MSLYLNMNISQTGLDAARKRLEAASSNLANAESSANSAQEVYQPLRVQQRPAVEETQGPGPSSALTGRGVFSEMISQQGQERLELDPDHPDADAEGFVHYPEVDINTEIAEMMSARRAYQAGLAAYSEAKQMFHSTLDVLRGA